MATRNADERGVPDGLDAEGDGGSVEGRLGVQSVIVPYEPRYRSGMIALWHRQFGEWSTRRIVRHWNWQFESNPFVTQRPPRLFVVVSERSDEVVGTLVAWPIPLRFQGRTIVTLCGGALALDAPYRGTCVDLTRRLVTSVPALAGGLHPSVRAIVKRFGFQYVPGTTRRFILRLRNDGERARRMRRRLRRSMTHLATPGSVSWLPRGRFARSLPATQRMPTCKHSADIRSLDRFDARYDELWARVSRTIPCTIERTSEYMNWRHVDCPTEMSFRLGLFENGVLRAVAVGVNHVENDWTGSPCVVHGEITELIADVPDSPGVEALLTTLLQYLDRRSCDTIASLGLHPTHHAMLRKLGFVDVEDERYAMVANPSSDPNHSVDLLSEADWYVSAADSDALYASAI